MTTIIKPIRTKPSPTARSQFAALCYRERKGKIQVLLITSRGSGRWIIPKGWPMRKMSAADAALQEAWEEAGVEGRLRGACLGIYTYLKLDEPGKPPCAVAVFAVKVKRLHDSFPEAHQRRRKWVSRKKAARMVQEPELSRILKNFKPKTLRKLPVAKARAL